MPLSRQKGAPRGLQRPLHRRPLHRSQSVRFELHRCESSQKSRDRSVWYPVPAGGSVRTVPLRSGTLCGVTGKWGRRGIDPPWCRRFLLIYDGCCPQDDLADDPSRSCHTRRLPSSPPCLPPCWPGRLTRQALGVDPELLSDRRAEGEEGAAERPDCDACGTAARGDGHPVPRGRGQDRNSLFPWWWITRWRRCTRHRKRCIPCCQAIRC